MSVLTRFSIVTEPDKRLAVRAQDLPALEPHQVLVEVLSVAQNPTDVQSFDAEAFGEGAVYGCDFAGRVQAVGSAVQSVAVGSKVAALIWGGEIKGLGAYASHCIADSRILYPIPVNLSFSQAATVSLAAATAWLALFSGDCLAIPRAFEQRPSVLIWGGSSSVGAFAIQLARHAGLKITTTCSRRNFDAARAYGAEHVFDYSDPDVVRKIREAVPDVAYAFDTIGNAGTSQACGDAIKETTQGGVMCTVRPGKAFTEGVPGRVRVTDVLVWTAFLKDHRYKEFYWPANQADHELAAELFANLSGWLRDHTILPNPVRKMGPLSIDTLHEGFELYRSGGVSHEKIVYSIPRRETNTNT